MISLKRTSAIMEKDFIWATQNLKLLGIMLMPILFVLIFSQLNSDATFVYVVTFTSSFIGLFKTSYLILEEKTKGTLLALLTTPLKSSELLIGKFFFSLALCLLCSLFAIYINNRPDLLTNPIILANFILYSGTTAFLGCLIGIFFKNEQEMSIIAPFVLVLFIIEDTIGSSLKYYLPNYHFAQTLSSSGVSPHNLLIHTGFNSIYFIGALILAAWYTRFYFSNNREKRTSPAFYCLFSSFIALYILSGLLSPKFLSSEDKINLADGTTLHMIRSDGWSGDYKLNQKNEKIETLTNIKSLKVFNLKPIKKDKESTSEYAIVLRNAKEKESNLALREKSVREDKKRFIVGMEPITINNLPFRKWTYYKNDKMVILVEAFCKNQILQIFADIKKPTVESIKKSAQKLDNIMSNFTPNCSHMEET